VPEENAEANQFERSLWSTVACSLLIPLKHSLPTDNHLVQDQLDRIASLLEAHLVLLADVRYFTFLSSS